MHRAILLVPTAIALLVSPAFFVAAAPDPVQPPASDLWISFLDPKLPLPGKASNISVQFNPKELTLDKKVPWGLHDNAHGDTPSLEFTSGKPHTVAVELMFDGFETKTDVSEMAAKLQKFVAPPEEKRPPTVLIQWGTGLQFKCILESFSLRFTLFLEDGTPVRATMNATFKELIPVRNETRSNPQH